MDNERKVGIGMSIATKHCCICTGVCYHIGPIRDCGNHDGTRRLNRALDSMENWQRAYETEHEQRIEDREEIERLKRELASLRARPQEPLWTLKQIEGMLNYVTTAIGWDAWDGLSAVDELRKLFRAHMPDGQPRDIEENPLAPSGPLSDEPRENDSPAVSPVPPTAEKPTNADWEPCAGNGCVGGLVTYYDPEIGMERSVICLECGGSGRNE